jgi:hypothetical protein
MTCCHIMSNIVYYGASYPTKSTYWMLINAVIYIYIHCNCNPSHNAFLAYVVKANYKLQQENSMISNCHISLPRLWQSTSYIINCRLFQLWLMNKPISQLRGTSGTRHWVYHSIDVALRLDCYRINTNATGPQPNVWQNKCD